MRGRPGAGCFRSIGLPRSTFHRALTRQHACQVDTVTAIKVLLLPRIRKEPVVLFPIVWYHTKSLKKPVIYTC